MAISTNQLFTPTPPSVAPQSEDTRNVVDWVMRQLQTISITLSEITRLQLQPVAAAPTSPRTGLVGMNDGANWNPLAFTEGSKQSLVTYRNGGWHQADLGPMTIDDLGFGSISSTGINLPQFNITNINDNAASAQLTFNKARSGTPTFNTQNGDNFMSLFASGFANGNFQQTAAILAGQDAASSGSHIPSRISFFTSSLAGPFDHVYTMDSGGSFSIPNNLTIGSFLISGFGAAIGSFDTYAGTSGTIANNRPFHIITPTAAFTATLTAANGLSPGLLQFFVNRAAFAVNSASNNVVPITGGGAGNTILPATIGAWCIMANDPPSNTWIIIARGT